MPLIIIATCVFSGMNSVLLQVKTMKPAMVPDQKEGKQNDLVVEAELASEKDAQIRYRDAKKRLLRPGTWQATAGLFSAEFSLFDPQGHLLEGIAGKGDYIRIDIPGPGPSSGDGYDWVLVTGIEEENKADRVSFALRVSPASPPWNHEGETAHFFTGSASSTFVITCRGRKVTATYHGRNEIINDHTGSSPDDLRNMITGSMAKAGFSEMQWRSLLKGFVN